VTNPDHIRDAAALIDGECGARGLQALVNNAGVVVVGPLELLPIDELRRQLEINFIGQLAVTQALLPLLRRSRAGADPDHRSGRIVFISSVSGRSALPFGGAYAASKFALEAAADALRVELLPFGMRVLLVEPGAIATPIWETSRAAAEQWLAEVPPEMQTYYGAALDGMRRRVARGVHGLPPERVADAVSHALVARRPRTRYVIGRDARARIIFQALLPTGLRDRIIAAAVRRL
jgi:NAD(P)-dependent dehydrogenase (short-subunit alcohol dehydrogenase family)